MKYTHLLGKQFDLGRQDCFQMCIDFFDENFNIKIPNIARPHDWDPNKLDLIGDFYHISGFEKIEKDEWPPRPADVLVTTVGGRNPNHLLIYLGGNEFIHHQTGKLSTQEVLRPAWRRFTSYILRHPDVPDMTPEKPLLDLRELMHDRFI